MLMTKKQFQDSIRARNPMNVWFLGKKIEDLTAFPPLAASFNAISKVYELAQRPAWKDLITVKSHLNGEDVSIYNAPLRSAEDANRKTRAARALAEVIGCCTHRCTGSEAFAGLGPACYDMDHDLGTHYFERFMTFLDYVDGGILSYRENLIKPDPAIYQLLMERYDLNPEESIFIDDTPQNVEAARKLGIHGIEFHTREQVLQEMAELGVTI